MCFKRASGSLKIGNKKIRIDPCMKHIIDFLNHKGVKTVGCCCGHGKYPMTIVMENWVEFYH